MDVEEETQSNMLFCSGWKVVETCEVLSIINTESTRCIDKRALTNC